MLIHAARVPDPRPEAWAQLPPELREAARLAGGVIGEADLTGVVVYRSPQQFVADRARHLNDPSWFQSPRLYGFVFADPRPLAFRPYLGNVRFFTVEDCAGEGDMTALPVSVRSAAEAEAALAGGAAVIDVKEPDRGVLGRADGAVIAAVAGAAAERAPVSAALGEASATGRRRRPSASACSRSSSAAWPAARRTTPRRGRTDWRRWPNPCGRLILSVK